MRVLFVLSFIILLSSCGEEVVVKPAAKLRLEYDLTDYRKSKLDCPFNFDVNTASSVVSKKNCGVNIKYPKMKATLYLSYQPVQDGNLESLLQDAQKLTYDHTVKANEIFEQPRQDTLNDVYGMFYIINGDAATQAQFYVTDSLRHFVSGALYFDTKPNFDSIYPAVAYLRDDIRRVMETITWEE